ncbi:MAG: GNAT family N-acetyltransferase [Geminicoccaceae bacterium]
MTVTPSISTRRLLLRPWRDGDLQPFAALNADPRVTEYFPETIDRAESDETVAYIREHFERHGFGPWAVEESASGEFIGCVGLLVPSFEAPFMPCVEILWRLAHEHWGKGYATEAASACLDEAFGPVGLDEVVAFTVPGNLRSRAVMERLGMRHAADEDFLHPEVPEGHPLQLHMLYRLSREAWASRRS